MRTILLLITVLLIPLHAFAEGSPEARAAAKQHYESGEKAFRLGDFDQAVAEWRESYKLSSVPLLLYNIAQAYRQKGDSKRALFFYQQFVATGPTGEARQIAERRIDELKQAIAAQQKAQAAPPQGPERPEATTRPQPPTPATAAPSSQLVTTAASQPRRWYKSPLAWSLVSVGAATIVAGGVLVGHGYDLQDQPFDSLQQQHDLQASSTNFQVAGWTVLGVGIASVVGGVVDFAIEHHREHLRRTEVTHE